MPFTDSQYTQRTKRKAHDFGSYYRETQEHFEIDHWQGKQDANVEDVIYEAFRRSESLKPGVWPQHFIDRIDYTGWRLNAKYFASHPKPSFEFKFYLRSEEHAKVKAFIELLSKEKFPSIAATFIDKNSDKATTFCAVSFYEQDNSKELNKFFDCVLALEPDLTKVIQDIKETISFDCFRWFVWKIEGQSRTLNDMSNIESACTKLHHNNFDGVPSPLYLAANYLKDKNKLINAAWLLGKISAHHWQYEQAQKMKGELENAVLNKDNEIADLKKQLEAMRLMLAEQASAPAQPVTIPSPQADQSIPLIFSASLTPEPATTLIPVAQQSSKIPALASYSPSLL